jgi:hypothetical protein
MPGEVDETGLVGLLAVELVQEPDWPLVVRPLVELTELVGLVPVELVHDVGLPLVALTDVGGLVVGETVLVGCDPGVEVREKPVDVDRNVENGVEVGGLEPVVVAVDRVG